jgi:hypothetical protein
MAKKIENTDYCNYCFEVLGVIFSFILVFVLFLGFQDFIKKNSLAVPVFQENLKNDNYILIDRVDELMIDSIHEGDYNAYYVHGFLVEKINNSWKIFGDIEISQNYYYYRKTLNMTFQEKMFSNDDHVVLNEDLLKVCNEISFSCSYDKKYHIEDKICEKELLKDDFSLFDNGKLLCVSENLMHNIKSSFSFAVDQFNKNKLPIQQKANIDFYHFNIIDLIKMYQFNKFEDFSQNKQYYDMHSKDKLFEDNNYYISVKRYNSNRFFRLHDRYLENVFIKRSFTLF